MSARIEKKVDKEEAGQVLSSCTSRRGRSSCSCSPPFSRSTTTMFMLMVVVVSAMIELLHWTYQPWSQRSFFLLFSSLLTLVRRPFLLSSNNQIFVSATSTSGGGGGTIGCFNNVRPGTTSAATKVLPHFQYKHHNGQQRILGTTSTQEKNICFISSIHQSNHLLPFFRRLPKNNALVVSQPTTCIKLQNNNKSCYTYSPTQQAKTSTMTSRLLAFYPSTRMKWARRDSNISYSFSSLSSTSSSPHDTSIQKDKQSHHDEIKNDKTVNKITLEMLSQELSRAFLKNDTDGILQIAPKIRKQSFTGQELIMSAMEATQNQKGQAAAILNGLIASCTALPAENEHTIDNARCAWDIYTAWEELKDELDLYPDLVTFCCTYSALKRAAVALESSEEKEVWYDHLQHVLEKAQRYSKKLAGSKRRKLLNTISRKRAGAKRNNADSIIAKNHLGYFQETYGEDFDILYEDNDTLVVNKPSGMICFHSHKTTSGKMKRKKKANKKSKGRNEEMVNDGDKEDINDMDGSDVSLEDALLNVGITLSTLNPDALGIVHRIDRGTSGCIVLAKNDDAHARLLTEFFTRRVQKQYTALVPFEVQKKLDNRSFDELQPSGIIDEAVGGKQALSLYKVVRRVGTSALLLDIHTKTGRKHQVRVHCASALGRPIFLDPLHNDLKKSSLFVPQPSKNDGKHFCLHASSLTINEFGIKVQSSLPKWWIPILECFEKH